MVSSAGGLLLARTLHVSGLEKAMSEVLKRWRAPRTLHDPAKVLTDVAIAVALGGDCAADIAVVRAQPELFGAVASDATVSRLIATLAGDVDAAVAAIRAARAAARAHIWRRQQPLAGTSGSQVIVDLDATLVTAHSDKQGATPTFKYGYGFHPMLAFVDHGSHGSGEALVGLLRPGSAGSNSAADHISVLDAALAQLPEPERARVLVRTDTGGGVKDFLHHITDLGLQYSVGFYGMPPIVEALRRVPRRAWRAALDGDGTPREGAQVAELTRYLPDTLKGWPAGMRVIARRERPHPGAQLRLTDDNGWRITCFATNTRGWSICDLEVRHRQRARAEDRIRNLKDTGLTNLPFHGFAQNQIWLEITLLAADLLVWTQVLAFTGHPARGWEPKRLRLRLLAVAGRIITSGRRRYLRLPRGWPWSDLIEFGWTALQPT
ncbi:IS1380 family transposase (plasmid) [Mycobacterium sp. SMC-8]|nr:IS1380 family transposase [Mycobacterium sp. SMC-8]UXA15136.1 IS1380 family transposase [Mycobacterium sp. SMC-8]UXA15213.1 IS1380 family transposase [Mycobacterium sp. SMC-8]UXA15276.1 IS1380 family transposase [Mycobacterium sp. SMC-8]UXA15284.1 IS1380 family transposase [Mycobacterium sp. SMC-8]